MRLLLYEWCCSGGLAKGAESLAGEGRLMLEALAADAAKEPTCEITVLVAEGLSLTLPPAARRLEVPEGRDVTALVTAARTADWTLIVAPETDDLLRERVRTVRAAGGRVLAPPDDVIALTTDKQATVDLLAARGLPVPAGRPLAAGEAVPTGFRLPAARKARASCGCEELAVIDELPCPSAAVPTRLEAWAEGTPVGVSLLCGPDGPVPLPVMRQRFQGGSRPRYVGSEPLPEAAAAARATELARRAARAIAAEAGWLGVDLILGQRADGRDDRVLELNPRVTTSVVGLGRLFASSLVAAMIAAASDQPVKLEPAAGRGAETGHFRVEPA